MASRLLSSQSDRVVHINTCLASLIPELCFCRIVLGYDADKKPRHNGRGYIVNYRNAPVVGGHTGGSAHLQNYQAILTLPACAVLAEAFRGVKIVALMALANLLGFALSSFHPLSTSIATDSKVAALTAHHRLPDSDRLSD